MPYKKIQADYTITCADSEPLANAIVVVDDGGYIKEVAPADTYSDVSNYKGVLCPGFINAHCHLELSSLHRKIPKHIGLRKFADYMRLRPKQNADEITQAMLAAETQMYANGIVAIGDISNTTDSFAIKDNSNLYYHTFVEIIGFDPKIAADRFRKGVITFEEISQIDRSHGSLTPHAPYTASLELLLLIKSYNEFNEMPLTSIHHQESQAENELYMNGTGEWANLYAELGIDINTFFRPLGATSLAFVWAYLARDTKVLLVHNTFCNQEDAEWLMTESPETHWCFCPNANLYIENRLPNFNYFLPYSDNICLGTDSLASNEQLCLLEEMKTIQHRYPKISLPTLVQWGCKNGAKFFDWVLLGTLEEGKQPGVCLIENLDTVQLKLLPESRSRLLVGTSNINAIIEP